MRERKLYVITRRDLEPSLRAVMALHVAADFAFRLGWRACEVDEGLTDGMGNPPTHKEWTNEGPIIVLMTLRNLSRLEAVATKFNAHRYIEPDMDPPTLGAIALYDYEFSDARCRLAEF